MTQKSSAKGSHESTIPLFIRKIYEILENNRFSDIIDWNESGSALIIKNPKEFCKKVLPRYFKHKNMTSFVRQLNMYDFHKQRTLETEHIYGHEFFQKGKDHLLKGIKRKVNEVSVSLQKTANALETIHNTGGSPKLCGENIMIQKLNKKAMGQIGQLEKDIDNLAAQNESLWVQICVQNEREELLKSMLQCLMQQLQISSTDLSSFVKEETELFRSITQAEKDLVRKQLFCFETPKQETAKASNDLTPCKNKNKNSLSSNLPTPQRPQDKSYSSTPHGFNKGKEPWNLEKEYLKSVATVSQFFHPETPLNQSIQSSELLGKRPLDPDGVIDDLDIDDPRRPRKQLKSDTVVTKTNDENQDPQGLSNLKDEQFLPNSNFELHGQTTA